MTAQNELRSSPDTGNVDTPDGSDPLQDANVSENPATDWGRHCHASHHLNDDEGEVSEVNPHTLNVEFHGPTSSLAFLAAIQQHVQKRTDLLPVPSVPQSLISAFHNDTFSPASTTQNNDEERSLSRYHFRHAQSFLDGYFQNLHFIHPIIDRSQFWSRCEDLWFGRSEQQPRSFVALYYAVMSLGALIREWDEDFIDGLDRFAWSRKMFQCAADALGTSLGTNDLETVQANMIMAKVCQNELNPNLAYMYLGIAIRTSLSAGHNRQSRCDVTNRQPSEDLTISKTWWGLYSLEIEMSFALGRPDSLGLDVYHNRPVPPADDSETAILSKMVDFARIIRKVSISVYFTTRPIYDKLAKAVDIEAEMDIWIHTLPKKIRPEFTDAAESVGMVKDPRWAKKQRHTLKFRYYNVKMVLYRPFLVYVSRSPNLRHAGLDAAVSRCVAAAQSTIRLVHKMFCDFSYFRTWWYNTTYTLYAASIILYYLTKMAADSEKQDLLQLIDMSIEVLDAMDENVVAKKASMLLQQASLRETDRAIPFHSPHPDHDTRLMQLANASVEFNQNLPMNDFFSSTFGEDQIDFMAQLFPLDDGSFSFRADDDSI